MPEGDSRQRKHGGAPRAHPGDAFTVSEIDQATENFRPLLEYGYKGITFVNDKVYLENLEISNVGLVVFFDTKRATAETHRHAAKAGLVNEIDNPLVITASVLDLLQKAAIKKL
jgi:hypothetical protein